MVSRKDLKNIASGLSGSFISRNNDVGGYWGIGKLCLLAQNHQIYKVHLDVTNQTITPDWNESDKLLAEYGEKLKNYLLSRGIPFHWVVSVNIDLDFNPTIPDNKYVKKETRGSLFKLKVSIIDDKGKVHEINNFSYCEPHNPKREIASLRSQ